MSLRIRRGTDAQRATTPLDLGELVFTTDTKQLYVGNGIDDGGDPIIRLGTGLAWADVECTTIIATGAALQVSADTDPSLGGNLNLNSYNIDGTGDISISGNIQTFQYLTDAVISSNLVGHRARGTDVTPLTVAANDQLLKIAALGYSSNGSFKVSSLITGVASSRYPITSTVVPGRINFTVADANGNLNLGLWLDADMGTRLQMFTPNLTQLGVYSYLTAAGGTGTYTSFGRYAGTTASPLALTTGDRIHSLRFMGYDGTTLLTCSQITSNVYGTVSTGQIQADIRLSCRNSSGTTIATQTNTATQIQFGVMPILPTFAGTAAADTAVTTPVNGMMFYDSVTLKITAYANGAWVALH